MSAPRLRVDLDKVFHNAHLLVHQMAERGISVSGVTKATLGSPIIAATMLRAGVVSIGDSRVENLERLRRAGIRAASVLIRSPMLSQAGRAAAVADISLNTEIEVIRQLSRAADALDRTHGVILMVELGDLREGIMPEDLESTVLKTLSLPRIRLAGLGTNLACCNGVTPDDSNMRQLSSIATHIESRFGISLDIVSGGNSASVPWALGKTDTGRVNHLRLGEAILLGREPLHREPLPGLFTDACTLVAEVIEANTKPTHPSGVTGESSFGPPRRPQDRGAVARAILAIGQQDVDDRGLRGHCDTDVVSSSSDHLVVESSARSFTVGDEVAFDLNYSALLRAMTSPFVAKDVRGGSKPLQTIPEQ